MVVEVDRDRVIEEAPVRITLAGGRPFARGVPGTLLLTLDELLVVAEPDAGSEVLMRQTRANLAMARRPARGGREQVELSALDGQDVTLRFDREHARTALTIAGWLAGV
jgi:hypothetical protein